MMTGVSLSTEDVSSFAQLFCLSDQDKSKKILEFSYEAQLLPQEFPHITIYEPRLLQLNERLPFADFVFDIAISGYYLFHDCLEDLDIHLYIIQELARVAKEVRIFPLQNGHDKPSVLLGPVLLQLQRLHYGAELREVAHKTAATADAMLRVWPQLCTVPGKKQVD